MIEKTGYCWNCGKVCGELFCNEKCERQHIKKQDKGNLRGKRAGYGLAGSTH